MKVADLLESRLASWKELDRLCSQLERSNRRKIGAKVIERFSGLYRSACADLALADAYQLPQQTIDFLHQLVGRAHNQLYRSRRFNYQAWGYELVYGIPYRLIRDPFVLFAHVLFWGVFIASALLAYDDESFAVSVLGSEQMSALQMMYSQENTPDAESQGFMTGVYIANNTSIGLMVFLFGLIFGVGGLWMTLMNACQLGTSFGWMATTPQSDNFFTFVTAHGPFELTAVVLAAAAGMRLGFSFVDTRGYTRMASLVRAAKQSLGTMALAGILFALAACVEGWISPSPLPYWIKAAVAISSTVLMLSYALILGFIAPAPPTTPSATQPATAH